MHIKKSFNIHVFFHNKNIYKKPKNLKKMLNKSTDSNASASMFKSVDFS